MKPRILAPPARGARREIPAPVPLPERKKIFPERIFQVLFFMYLNRGMGDKNEDNSERKSFLKGQIPRG